jgi:hypothetical protein
MHFCPASLSVEYESEVRALLPQSARTGLRDPRTGQLDERGSLELGQGVQASVRDRSAFEHKGLQLDETF